MNSFNHYSFGSVGEWMYSTVGGIELDENAPGYKHFNIRPQPGGGLSRADTSLDTIHGKVATAWTLDATTFTLIVTVPVNTTANVFLPFAKAVMLDGQAPVPAADGSYALGSGRYTFTAAVN